MANFFETKWRIPNYFVMSLTVVVADRDPLTSEALAEHLSQPPELAAKPSPGAAREALDAARGNGQPAVLLISENLLDDVEAGALAARLDGGRRLPALVLGGAPDAERTLHFLLLGCMGYVSRRENLGTLRKAVRSVAAGEFWAPRNLLPQVVRALRDRREQERALTAREREILALIHARQGNVEIAGRLFISVETVRWHVRRLFAKIGVENRAGAAEFAHRYGIVWQGRKLPAAARREWVQIVSRTG
jgi:DNA-binding NarL/FixJ family response regulator